MKKTREVLRIVPLPAIEKFSIVHVKTGLDCNVRFNTLRAAEEAVAQITKRFPDVGTWTKETIDGWGDEERQNRKRFFKSLQTNINDTW